MNKDFDSGYTANIIPDFTCIIDIRNSSEADESLFAEIRDVQVGNAPFEVVARILGNFKYNEEDSEEITFESYLSESTIAILFPYLRVLYLITLLNPTNTQH